MIYGHSVETLDPYYRIYMSGSFKLLLNRVTEAYILVKAFYYPSKESLNTFLCFFVNKLFTFLF